jgi:hypothetical protein
VDGVGAALFARERYVTLSVEVGNLPKSSHTPLCHLDRSEAQWRDLCVDAPSWKCFTYGVSIVLGPPNVKLQRGKSSGRKMLQVVPGLGVVGDQTQCVLESSAGLGYFACPRFQHSQIVPVIRVVFA